MIKSIPVPKKQLIRKHRTMADYRAKACDRPTLSLREEAIATCRRIEAQSQRPIYVCLSGGIKSETTAEAFRIARVPFKAAILRFKKDLNIHDIVRAVIYCEARGVPYEFFEFDLEQFMLRKYQTLKDNFGFSIEDGPATTELILKINRRKGFAVLGGGFPEFRSLGAQPKWRKDRRSIRVQRWAREMGIRCETSFFDSDPQLLQSIVDCACQDASGGQLRASRKRASGMSSIAIMGNIIYENFNLPLRKSYHGYEKYIDAKRLIAGRPK